MTQERILALDFGGTKHTVGVLDRATTGWAAHRRIFTPRDADAVYDRQAVLHLAQELLDGRQPAAIGVSFGGPVDATTGTVRLSHHVPGWENFPLAAWLSDELGAQASVDNDANVAALGEYHYGAGQGVENLMYVTVSTGVGGGWILNGRPWRGHEGMAGEIGHTMVDPAGPVCLCGKRGCVERLASGPYMAQDAGEQLATQLDKGRLLRELAARENGITGKLVAEAAAQGDDIAWAVLERGAWALGVGLGNAANLLNPQRFILGGGVTKSGERWWQTVDRVAHDVALPEVHFDIRPAALEDDAPLWGAVALAEELLKES